MDRLVHEANLKALADYGPALPDALEHLQFDRKQLLPEEIYRDVLPKYGRVYAALDELASADLTQRRRAAEELAELSGKQPPGRLAIARLAQLVGTEQDALVWQSAMRAIADDGSQPAIDLAYAAIGNASSEVRRRACEHLAAHPDTAHVPVLIPALEDKDQAVVCAAIRALAASGNMNDTKPLRNLLGSMNEDVQMEAALALTSLGDPSGKPALERLAYSRDPAVRKNRPGHGRFPRSGLHRDFDPPAERQANRSPCRSNQPAQGRGPRRGPSPGPGPRHRHRANPPLETLERAAGREVMVLSMLV